MKRVSLSEEDLLKPYPPLGNRQYIVPKGPKLTKAEQDFKKRVFWYKNYLLNLIDISWESVRSRLKQMAFHINLSFHILDSIKEGIVCVVRHENKQEHDQRLENGWAPC